MCFEIIPQSPLSFILSIAFSFFEIISRRDAKTQRISLAETQRRRESLAETQRRRESLVQSSAEVDLILAHKGKIIPIEIKSGVTGTLKSLHQFVNRSEHHYAVRIYSGKFEILPSKTPEGKNYFLMNLPYYLGTQIYKYLDYFFGHY